MFTNFPINERRIFLGITGASGSIYAERLLQALVNIVPRVYVCVSENGAQVLRYELAGENALLKQVIDEKPPEHLREKIRVFKSNDLFAPVASGSSAPTDMVLLPCSMGTLGRIAHGVSSNLIERAADVVLKQKRRLILCPRETPLHLIHLRNMTTLAEAGAMLIPPMPAFYQKPKSVDDMVDFVVGRVLEGLEIPHELYQRWNTRML